MGSDHNLGLDHQALAGQTPDGRTLQEHDGFPLRYERRSIEFSRIVVISTNDRRNSLYESTISSELRTHKYLIFLP